MSGYVGATHEFHDADFVREWGRRFEASEPRLRLFGMILDEIIALGLEAPHVLELGTGPGHMAKHILAAHPTLSYEALDFSTVFLDVARETLGDLTARVTFTVADLTDPNWPDRLSQRPDAIISTWALHDLGSQAAVADVYARAFTALGPGGLLVNGDFIKPDGTEWEFEPGRFEIERHLEMLRDAGFAAPASIGLFEPNAIDPTAAQNYACLTAHR